MNNMDNRKIQIGIASILCIGLLSGVAGGAADKAGIKAGDRIVSADGKEIGTAADLKSVIESHSVGDLLKLVIERNGSEVSVALTLNEET